MKILFVGRNAKVGGPSTFVYRACLGLHARGHEVHFAAQGGAMMRRFGEASVQFHRVWPTPFNRLQLRGLLKSGGFDMVHACNSIAGDDVAWAARRVRPDVAWVLSVHGNLPDHVTGNRCLREAWQVMTFDQSAVERLRKIPWMRERHIHLMPRPVERREMRHQRTAPPQVVMVSRLSKSKSVGAFSAIDAVAALQDEFPGLSLLIVGGGSQYAEVKARCREVNARLGRPLATALGSLTDPFPAMAGATCVVGTSYVAFEALYHEIPVVAAGYEGYGVVTPDNLKDAIGCNFGDGLPGIHKHVTCELLQDGFRRVLTTFFTPEGRSQLKEIRARLEENHSLDQVARRLETIYEAARRESAKAAAA